MGIFDKLFQAKPAATQSALRCDGVYILDLGPGPRTFFRFFPDGYVLCARRSMPSSDALNLLVKGAKLDGIGIGTYSLHDGAVTFVIHFPGRAISHTANVLPGLLLAYVQVKGTSNVA